MAIDRKSKCFEITCPSCNEPRFVTYTQNWNISTGKNSGRCPKCKLGVNTDGLKKGHGWNRGMKLSGMSGKKHGARFLDYLASRRGVPMSETAKQKMRLAKLGLRGPLANRWKGGITPLRRTVAVKEWRMAVFTRGGFTCQKCGCRGGTLNAHHIKSWAKHPEHRFDVDNGVTLCVNCHRDEHRSGRGAKCNSHSIP